MYCSIGGGFQKKRKDIDLGVLASSSSWSEDSASVLEPVWITLILSNITRFSLLSFQNAWVPQKILCLAWF